jgi:hypothetical protein
MYQVYGICNKASDVRSVVTSLNARRQAADDARDAEWPDEYEKPASPAIDAHQKLNTDWDAFLEQVRLCCPAACRASACSLVAALRISSWGV